MRKLKDINEDEIVNVIKNSISREDVFRKLNVHHGPTNRSFIKKFISDRGIDISHFDRIWHSKTVRKYNKITKICPQCNCEFETVDGGKNSSITCSPQCSNIFFAHKRMNEEIKVKISHSLQKFHNNGEIKPIRQKRKYYKQILSRTCIICQKDFVSKKTSQKSCSRKCGGIVTSNRIKKSVLDGKHKGWAVRPTASYAEKYFQFRLNELNIEYEFNKPISKSSLGLKCAACYFLDFYFPEIKLDLEIDGKQHLRPERKESDIKRDELLKGVGIQVFRIPWINPVNEEKKSTLENSFQEFLKLYYRLSKSS